MGSLTDRSHASGLPSRQANIGGGVQDSVRFLCRRIFMQESKDNQPDSFRDASVTRREIETLERDRRIEM